MFKQRFLFLSIQTTLGCLLFVAAITSHAALAQGSKGTPVRFDLRVQQTPIKDQGGRNTCITFASIAALEAAYKRAGHGEFDLAEEFLNHVGKMTWLHNRWNELRDKGADYTENQVGAFGGGGGMGYISQLANGYAVPEESYMPYRPGGYPRETGGRAWTDPYWKVQSNVSSYNLDPRILPVRALQAPRYFSVQEYQWIYKTRAGGDSTFARQFEETLHQGYEIVWDFDVSGDRSTSLWKYKADARSIGSHSMIIIGYDRSSPDPSRHFFIAKNSWGPTTNPGGYTHISYDYLKYGYTAGYIKRVKSPHLWRELAFIGRWSLSFDGHHGTLDIYHLPGLMRSVFENEGVAIADRRLGTFYDAAGKAYRVNGLVSANQITFYIDWSRPNLRWDELPDSARKFNYRLFMRDKDLDDRRAMAGFHNDPNRTQWGGYAARAGFLIAPAEVTRPLSLNSYLGRWAFETQQLGGVLELTRRSGNTLYGQFIPSRGGTPQEALLSVATDDPARIYLSSKGRHAFDLDGRILSHDRGIMAGLGARPGVAGFTHLATFGFYATRIGDAGR